MNKFISLLGIGKKAGFITTGETGVEIDIKKKKAFLIIVAEDASENTHKKFKSLSESRKIDFVTASDKATLGNILGKGYVAVVSVKDRQFSKALLEKLKLD